MTADSTAPRPFDVSDLFASLRQGLAMVLKVILGSLVVLAAGILAVSLAMVGLILAAVAVAYRFAAGERAVTEPREATPGSGDGIVLDAHRTAHGWTVE